MTVPSSHLLLLAALLFSIGVAGFFLRRNVIVVLLCIELMLNAANLTFLAASRMHSLDVPGGRIDLQGPIFAIFVIVVAAVEAAVGLALVIALYRRKQTVSLDDVVELKD
ncbi:MAG: NADH-quinone oxidoreductase subunit NuoK [Planctomycetes bacterium]|nr:NADH-quinone oxidoreductase subunit NuoK [Planctomycetota bacterium]